MTGRDTSISFRKAVNRQESDEVLVILITFEHDDLDESIRISTDNADEFEVLGVSTRGTISNGANFVYTPITIELPTDSEGIITQAQISMENISREIINLIRGLSESPTITMQVVRAEDPDVIEAEFSGFELVDFSADALILSGTLTLDNFLSEPYPGGSMLPSNFPGLF
jgi:hypothetical protein